MERRSLLVGVLAGGWAATLLAVLPVSPFRSAVAEDPPGVPVPRPTADPMDPLGPGRTINPLDGPTRERGIPTPGFGTSGSNAHAIAITGPVAGGESVVYYFDTDHQRLLVYQYRSTSGGSVLSPNDRGGIALVAARHIDYDLKLEEYRDRSEKSRDQLKAAYDAQFGRGGAGGDKDMPVKKVEIPGGK